MVYIKTNFGKIKQVLFYCEPTHSEAFQFIVMILGLSIILEFLTSHMIIIISILSAHHHHNPVNKLSIQKTYSPLLINFSIKCEPIKPAPPVTMLCVFFWLLFFIDIRYKIQILSPIPLPNNVLNWFELKFKHYFSTKNIL